MLPKTINTKKIILASQSPRRQELLSALEIPFEIRLKPVDESYDPDLDPAPIAEAIARKKASVFRDELNADEILITGDTLVFSDGKALGKPQTEEEAREMLGTLSGTSHQVVSSVCITTPKQQLVKSDLATVHFKKFTEAEINHYIRVYKPFDKAGAYGIQEWLGHIGMIKLEGSYNTVMGLPTHLLYEMLEQILREEHES